jgi:hypothetical protein
MGISMLDYSKMILEKVSFDAQLFQKEFKKAISKLMPSDAQELQNWCTSKFGENQLCKA